LRKKREVVGVSAGWKNVESRRRCCGFVVDVGVGTEFVRLVGRGFASRDGEAKELCKG